MTTNRLSTGDTAPAFSLPDAQGNTVSLADYAGQKVIVYFYPKAMTPGCTTQACDILDRMERLAAEGNAIVRNSPDPVEKFAKCTDKDEINFQILSDEDHAVAEAYGAWGDKKNYGRFYEGLDRSTIVINEN